MKKFLFISFVLMITFIISCGKKEEASVSISNNSVYVSDPNNIYHKTYTNVVKVQGKYVSMNSAFSYGNRKEGEYSEDYDIFEAIQNHSLKRVQELVEEEGEDIDQTYLGDSLYSEFMDDSYAINGATPLIFAIFYRDLGIMKYLLDKGADPYIKDDDGWNSFLWACGTGNVNVIKMLVEFDSDLVDSKNIYQGNGLHVAAMYDNVEVFEYLVNDLGIDINSTDEDGDGVLYYAEKDEAIEKLRELGAEE
ncbi:ankyrin repeat domain-containing protein [Brachyspira hyodysenteriae]|nr:ankyrin repeat domain-containing protein [Brachyspira hyodysenteriae]MCZ9925640.1 ankyrin repeat domain-containing protein [Brachyspira hyodysenteriae]MDA0035461.1 ankyrin repeat domain-containing protein [Brachyspira hyodysenteriae]MDA0049548.1 ankyrin repeat domain-containing protein [Brachyspira hyodysenteriae]MDA0064356.1 ankyrin repeat domain-containing protein [Brachyspira hyodysenteriae]MDA0066857.1 ankyrin repeat domain-containing protein [Brachyspira hyodysenteriae]